MLKYCSILFLLFSAFIYKSCIDPLEIEVNEAQRVLVVEGSIDTGEGPHRIFVSKSAQYGSRAVDEIILEKNAVVWIRDNLGEQIFLAQEKEGVYITPSGFTAKVGSTYTLFVTLENGQRYVSLPEKVIAVPDIIKLSAQYKEQPGLDDISKPVGIDIFANWQDPADVENFHLFTTRSVYKLHTRPDLHLTCGPGGCFLDPKDCCAICYVTEPQVNQQLKIFKDNFTNGQELNELIIHVADDGRRYSEKIMIVIESASLTKEAFQFYNVLRDQLAINGDIFDPPASAIRGNMINLDDPTETTIGYFRASDIFLDSIFVENKLLSNPKPLDLIRDDCRELKNSTIEKPSYWID